MRNLNYNWLQEIHKNIKPYRGSNRYPMWDRKQRHKYMIPVVENGKTEYHVCYYWTWTRDIISKEDYEAIQNDEVKKSYILHEVKPDGSEWYCSNEKTPHVLAIVREDNTIEFVAKYLNQGDRYYLSQLASGYFWSDVRRGGVQYRDYHVGKTIPIFKNLRIYADTLNTYEKNTYEVVTLKVDRTKAKQAMQDYLEPFKFAEVMFKAMSKESFLMLTREEDKLAEEYMKTIGWNRRDEAYMKLGIEKIKTDEIGGTILLMLGTPFNGLSWRAQRYAEGGTVYGHENTPIQYYETMTKHFKRMVYIASHAFVEETHSVGERYPSSVWRMEFRINGDKAMAY